MSIEIKYHGRIGNHLFQYVFARLLAVKNNLFLKTDWDFSKIIRTTEHEEGNVFEFPIKHIQDLCTSHSESEYIDNYKLHGIFNEHLENAKYIIDGFFENSTFYNDNEKLIKSFFILNDIDKNNEDIVMNLRLGDFDILGRILHPKWYLDILDKESFNKLYVVGSKADEPYLKFFKEYNPIVIPTNPVDDFHFIRKFDKIVCSNSTYCWWAAFLSEANRIYIPDRWMSPFLKSCKKSTLVKSIFYQEVENEFYTPKTKYNLNMFKNT